MRFLSHALLAATVLMGIGCGGAQRASLAQIEGNHIVIDRHINFESDSDVILSDSNDLLDAIADLLSRRSDIGAMHVIGHTDSAGGDEHNQELSERRAAAVERALRERGVTQPIDSRGAGESEQVCEEDTDECHAMNRRVEFVIEL